MQEYQQGPYRAKTIHYPDGGVETVAWRHEPPNVPDPEKAAHRRSLREGFEGLIRVTSQRSEGSCRRAKSRLRRHCRAIGADRMLTFTTREQANSRELLAADWDLLRRRVSKVIPGFRYVAVVEQHPSNPDHCHLHVAVCGFHDINVLRREWHAVLRRRIESTGSPGNVHVRRHADNPERVARYIAKYLGKTIGGEFLEGGRKSYWLSRSAAVILRSRITRWVPSAESWAELVLELVGDECICEVYTFNPQPGVLWLSGRVV